MEDFEVKIILISKLQMMKQLLNDNYIREEFGIQKFKVGILGASIESTYVFAQSSGVWAQFVDLSTQSIQVSVYGTYVLT
jgi:hypothetical protein